MLEKFGLNFVVTAAAPRLAVPPAAPCSTNTTMDDFDFDDDMTDEERTRVVECCTPADLEGLQAGEIIGAWQFSVLI